MLANLKFKPHRSLQSGFTLLEVLITLIVLAIGLLGLAGLQIVSLRNNHGAYLRSQAIIQSYDMVDRMRANSDQMGTYNLGSASYAFSAIGVQTTACDSAGGCTAAQMAGHDLYKWNQSNRSLLPQGVGIVCRDGTSDGSDIDDGGYTSATDTVTTGCTNAAADPLVVKIFWIDDRSDAVSRFSTVIGDRL